MSIFLSVRWHDWSSGFFFGVMVVIFVTQWVMPWLMRPRERKDCT